jgi:hypothetical protein
MFQNAVDICNRALQHCGVPRISATLGFTEDTKQAAECAFVYDKLRRAELRRNTWRFAIRRSVLRPINSAVIQGPGFPASNGPQTPTMLIAPALWDSTKTYFPGALVSDETNTIWMNTQPDNLNNTPANSSYWEQYFGPLTAQAYDPTTSYFAGELVYNTVGDGVFRTYVSLQNSNMDNPTIPTLWSSSAYYFTDQIVIFYPAWSAVTTYSKGQCISYSGVYYASLVNSNTNRQPDTSTTYWEPIPVPSDTAAGILPWDSATTYNIGDFADYGGTQYVSTVASNTGLNPSSNAASWSALTNGTLYLSKIDANLNNEPDLSAAPWSASTSYSAGATVAATDGYTYTSLVNSNLGNDPTQDAGTNWVSTNVLTPWTSSFVGGTGANQFMALTTALTDTMIFYPLGTGPAWQQSTRNVFRLPANYLGKAPQAPKAGSQSNLGAPSNMPLNDWELEGNYIVSGENGPINFRFVADVTDVTKMDDMFCEGLACRVALEVCETLTQSTAKTQSIASQYQKFMTEARMVNAIETGPEEQPLDDFIACRA